MTTTEAGPVEGPADGPATHTCSSCGRTKRLIPRTVENGAYGAMILRYLRKFRRRLVDRADVGELRQLVDMRTEVEDAIRAVVVELSRAGYSWTDIGRELRITKQSAHARYAADVAIAEAK